MSSETKLYVLMVWSCLCVGCSLIGGTGPIPEYDDVRADREGAPCGPCGLGVFSQELVCSNPLGGSTEDVALLCDVGAASDVVFVSSKGSDDASGDRMHPVETLHVALELAKSRGVRHVAIAGDGAYTLEGVKLQGMWIAGGFDEFFQADATQYPTLLGQIDKEGDAFGVSFARCESEAGLSHLIVDVHETRRHATGVSIYECSVVLQDAKIRVTDGVDGAAGMAGASGAPGGDGGHGGVGGSLGARTYPGIAGVNDVCGHAGGAGGEGGIVQQSNLVQRSTAGGKSGGQAQGVKPGQHGNSGEDGMDGIAAKDEGALIEGVWVASSPLSSAQVGTGGQGGGGGEGGFIQDRSVDSESGGGGGGGAGGCGGMPGGDGEVGGASLGVTIESGSLVLRRTSVVVGRGGSGGGRGAGGFGGAPGDGGQGAAGLNAPAGMSGGHGGRGGAGGNGAWGWGGPSVGVWCQETGTLVLEDSMLSVKSGGLNGNKEQRAVGSELRECKIEGV